MLVAAGGAGGGVGGAPPDGVPTDRPLRLLFIGNSFTYQGPIPEMVRTLAAQVGWPVPEVEYSAFPGESLAGHRMRPETLALVEAGPWDFVVLQDFSTRPTDNAGDPLAFKTDATWFYDTVKQWSPAAHVVLYETWARHPDHGIYTNVFIDPAEMQAQLRFHYQDAFANYIPDNASAAVTTDLLLAPVGDAWEAYLAQPNALRLHDVDDYHASGNGRYLNAVTLYATIYGVAAAGVDELNLNAGDASTLQQVADATTGNNPPAPTFPVPALSVGQTIRLDFGAAATAASGWNGVTDCLAGSLLDLVDANGAITGVDFTIRDAFAGSNELGLAGNALGFPGDVSSDVCWLGSFDGHTQALLESATFTLDNVDGGSYALRLFASRADNDGGNGRLTRYTVAGVNQDLEVSDNTASEALFDAVAPDAAGRIAVRVAVSPAGASRFGYLGALTLTKTGE